MCTYLLSAHADIVQVCFDIDLKCYLCNPGCLCGGLCNTFMS
uniref:Uncharacterized protein n=1 Tax=Anguilla anguilla TaxID=7936 RepID=A0A0E9XMB5_ANGAN